MTATRWRKLALVGLLAALTVAWSALPLGSGAAPLAVLCVAILGAAFSLLELMVHGIPVPSAGGIESLAGRMSRYLITGIRSLPWAELMTVAVLVLEAEHAARPWHTGMLAVALLGYLMAVHLAETGDSARLLRRQLPLIAAGLGITAVAIGAAALPGLPVGPASSVLRIVAAVAAVIAAALVIPTWLTRD